MELLCWAVPFPQGTLELFDLAGARGRVPFYKIWCRLFAAGVFETQVAMPGVLDAIWKCRLKAH
jgi:hypothetical protein